MPSSIISNSGKSEFKFLKSTIIESASASYEFLTNYIIECLEHKINFDMYGFINEYNNAHTYLYSTQKDLNTKLNIINKIGLKDVNTPPINESIISFYSLSHLGIVDKDGEEIDDYNTYFNELSEVAYYRVIAKLIIPKIRTKEDLDIINNFISLKKVKKTTTNSPLQAMYNNKTFNNIKDVVNRYIPDVSNTIRIYMENDEKIKTLIAEFKKSMSYIANAINGQQVKNKINIALNM